MSTFDYAEMAGVALELLTEFGASVSLRRVTTGQYDPDLGGAPVTTATYAGTGAKFDIEQQHINGTTIKQGDQQVYLAVQQADGQPMPAPQAADEILIGAAVWRVIAAETIAPADVPVLYIAQVRQ